MCRGLPKLRRHMSSDEWLSVVILAMATFSCGVSSRNHVSR
jgi:hypothetical protein